LKFGAQFVLIPRDFDIRCEYCNDDAHIAYVVIAVSCFTLSRVWDNARERARERELWMSARATRSTTDLSSTRDTFEIPTPPKRRINKRKAKDDDDDGDGDGNGDLNADQTNDANARTESDQIFNNLHLRAVVKEGHNVAIRQVAVNRHPGRFETLCATIVDKQATVYVMAPNNDALIWQCVFENHGPAPLPESGALTDRELQLYCGAWIVPQRNYDTFLVLGGEDTLLHVVSVTQRDEFRQLRGALFANRRLELRASSQVTQSESWLLILVCTIATCFSLYLSIKR
jgi:hypothetical protein